MKIEIYFNLAEERHITVFLLFDSCKVKIASVNRENLSAVYLLYNFQQKYVQPMYYQIVL